jgi:hypothetical protein
MYLLIELTNASNDYQSSTVFRVVNKFLTFFRLFLQREQEAHSDCMYAQPGGIKYARWVPVAGDDDDSEGGSLL